MHKHLDWAVIRTLAVRTFRKSVESPAAYLFAFIFYGFIGAFFGFSFFLNNQASISQVGDISAWLLSWLVPGLTMGLITEELSSGTFEQLSTLPVRDSEVVLGKYLGFALLSACVIGGLCFYPLVVSFFSLNRGLDVGSTVGVLASLYILALVFGAMGLFASSLAKNQFVSFIAGMIFCMFFLFIGQFYVVFPSFMASAIDSLGLTSHLGTMSRGVWDIRDLFYFVSLGGFFLYLTTQRLNTRRF